MDPRGSVRAGVRPYLNITPASQEEQKIVHRFGKVFQIGFYREDMFKQLKNRFFFAKPTDDFKMKFNIENEILVLFNDLPTFETRTFDFVDKLTTEYSNRLDRICVVVVSKDPNIEARMEVINAKQDSGRIVVPFTYSELLSAHQEAPFIENRFRKFFYSRDLFDLDSPIRTDSFFYGRNHIVQRFYDRYSNSENSALFGLRKIGKTSVLYALKRVCDQRGVPSLYIDCQSPSLHKRRWFEALQYIVRQASKQLHDIKDDWLSDVDYKEKDSAVLFEQDLKKLSTMKGNRRILLILDEVENIAFDLSPSEHWKNGQDFLLFWQTLRSIFQSNRDIFCFIVAGVNPTILERTAIKNSDNPIFNIATPQYLELFTLDVVRDMVSDIGRYMGLSFEEEVFFLLHEDFGGHPFLTRIACSNISRLIGVDRPRTVTKYWYRQNKDKFSREVMNYVEQLLFVLREFYAQEYSLLEILAGGDSRKFEETVGSLPSAAKHLEGYGLVNMRRNEYYFRLKIVEEFLQSRSVLVRVFSTKEEKIAEVSRRRNTIEDKLKKLATVILHASYGVESRARVLKAIPEERRAKIEHLPLDDILTDHFYFLDMVQLYVKEFKWFENIFEKQSERFYSALDHINRFRIDAHAKDISDDDLQMLILDFNWLDKCLSKVNL
jgi:hypothetical protein